MLKLFIKLIEWKIGRLQRRAEKIDDRLQKLYVILGKYDYEF